MIATGPSLVDHWLAALPGSAGSRAVGESYLLAFPQERDVETLRRLLSADLPARGAADCADPTRELRSRIRAEFAAGEVVQVSGWILSRSEARLAALRSLAG